MAKSKALPYTPGTDVAHPGEPHQWANQWNRRVCTQSNCSVMKTLVSGIEYEDQLGRIDPYSFDPDVEEESVPAVTTSTQELNVNGETQDDLTTSI